jgi:protein gp37
MAPKKYANGFNVTCHPAALDEPMKIKKPQRIFVCSMGDLFHENVPFEFIAQVYGVMSICKQHTFIVLTKRPDRALEFYQWCETRQQELYKCPADQNIYLEYLPGDIVGSYTEKHGDEFPDEIPLENVWFGVSAENQARADERIPILFQIPATVKFVSCEPMLGSIELQYTCFNGADSLESLAGIDWIICGGESGPDARPMHPDWARSLRDQCKSSAVPFFFKQWGEWLSIYDRDKDDPDWRECPKDKGETGRYLNLAGGHGFHGKRVVFVKRVGKKKAGNLLDGVEYREFPSAKHNNF